MGRPWRGSGARYAGGALPNWGPPCALEYSDRYSLASTYRATRHPASTDRRAKGRPFASAGAFFSISPEILKPIRRERRVADRRSNRPVAKIVLDRSGVPP